MQRIGREIVIAGGDASEVLQLGEEPLDQVALAVEALAEAAFPAPIALGRYVGCGTLFLDQVTDAVGIIGLVRQHDGARAEVVEQRVGDLPIMRLAGGQNRAGSGALAPQRRGGSLS